MLRTLCAFGLLFVYLLGSVALGDECDWLIGKWDCRWKASSRGKRLVEFSRRATGGLTQSVVLNPGPNSNTQTTALYLDDKWRTASFGTFLQRSACTQNGSLWVFTRLKGEDDASLVHEQAFSSGDRGILIFTSGWHGRTIDPNSIHFNLCTRLNEHD